MSGVETEQDKEHLGLGWSPTCFFYSHYSADLKVIIVQVRPEN